MLGYPRESVASCLQMDRLEQLAFRRTLTEQARLIGKIRAIASWACGRTVRGLSKTTWSLRDWECARKRHGGRALRSPSIELPSSCSCEPRDELPEPAG